MKEELNIRGRELSKTEQTYVTRWLDQGFTPEALAIAYDRTVVKLGRLHWSYMDKIIQSWHLRKLHTPEEIEAGDKRRSSAASRGTQPGVTEDDYRFLDKI